MMHGTYIGIRARLKGKTALLQEGPGGYYAQFDDRLTRLGYGWHYFPRSCFEVTSKHTYQRKRVIEEPVRKPLKNQAGWYP